MVQRNNMRSKTFTLAIVATAAVLAWSLAGQDQKPPQKNWKDQTEYDLYQSIIKDSNPAAQLEKVEQWKSKYPQSDFADVRLDFSLALYQAVKPPRVREAFDTAKEILKANPNKLLAVHAIITLAPQLKPQPTPDDLAYTDQTARYIIANLDTIYNKDNRPTTITDEQAAQGKPIEKLTAERSVEWVDTQRKDTDKTIADLTKFIQDDPTQVQLSVDLGKTYVAMKKVEMMPLEIYDYARAGAYTGPGALDANARKQMLDFASRAYVNYHGSNEGFDKVTAMAAANALPPADYHIKSKIDIAEEAEKAEVEAAKANPMLTFWMKFLKEPLTKPDGASTFADNIKDHALPGGIPAPGTTDPVNKFKGKLVSQEPALRPKKLVLSVADPDGKIPDATLLLEMPLPGKMEPGGVLEFDGVPDSFTADPFMVVFKVDDNKSIVGWTGKNAPARPTSKGKGK